MEQRKTNTGDRRGMTQSRIIVALDFSDPGNALELVSQLDPARCRLKVGKELFTRSGPELVKKLVEQQFDVFLDLKFHDIPNTVAKACEAAADLGIWMLNVHAQGGRKMMEAARKAINKADKPPLLIAVTILTSLQAEDLQEIGLAGTPADNVRKLATLAQQSGLDGVVCSPQEITQLRNSLGTDFQLVTPGIRPRGEQAGDQKRVTTPAEAIRAGADYLVIGRPITAAQDPIKALQEIEQEILTATET
jgi:orotidine-5'-phosphate decarboxylase